MKKNARYTGISLRLAWFAISPKTWGMKVEPAGRAKSALPEIKSLVKLLYLRSDDDRRITTAYDIV